MDNLASAPVRDGDDAVLAVAWQTRPWGWFLLVVSAAGVAVALAVHAGGKPWTPADLFGDVVVPLVAAYLGLVLLHNHTEVRLEPNGAIRVRTVPLPFRRAARLAAGELAAVEVSRTRSYGSVPWNWHIELVTLDEDRHSLCFGGVGSSTLAERTAGAVREFLRMGPAPRR